ncbi:hypothetical protein [Pseudomonas sp. S1(2024)]|uniref:hypothetical protein n=1 Tax=Pseudomonas sp. S1(2024) TaxID=3390191 RepID=UPI00397D2ECC
MDRIFLTDKTTDFIDILVDELQPISSIVTLNLNSPLSEQMEAFFNDHDQSPVVAVIDIGGGKPLDWNKPLVAALDSRVIGGVQLPDQSSIFILTEWSIADLVKPDYGAPFHELTSKVRLTNVAHDFLVANSAHWFSEPAAQETLGYVFKNVIEGIQRARGEKTNEAPACRRMGLHYAAT